MFGRKEKRFRPFQKVVARYRNEVWCALIFSHYTGDEGYNCGGLMTTECIPYRKGKHLLGTTNDYNEVAALKK